ncbi:unnamed protein product [Cuscuta campestris]|uniref:Uncharacterized protein n=1 Tax=Cuscuta campestris TaxID=132261 RepID=A0A484KRS9_9ASTE|nr:unnamed protein product [Cuscuta campestris]
MLNTVGPDYDHISSTALLHPSAIPFTELGDILKEHEAKLQEVDDANANLTIQHGGSERTGRVMLTLVSPPIIGEAVGSQVRETTVPKTEDEFDAEDIKKIKNYAKAINMLYCVINPDDYRKISCYSTAKEMWDKLKVTYEGTNQVRKAKINFLTQEYEMFKMKEGEKIEDLFDLLSKIINDLHALKKSYSNNDLVRKILRSLTPEWCSKADAIYESIEVSNVTIDRLRGNLKTYKSTILNPSLDEQRKKGIALKATKKSVEGESSEEDNEFTLVIKKFNKFTRKEFERKGKKHDDPLKCYGYNVTPAGRRSIATGIAAPPARANLASIADSLNRLPLMVDGMGGYLEQIDEAVQRHGYAMNAYFQHVNYVPPSYQATFLGQGYGEDKEGDASYALSSSLDEDEFDDAIDGDPMDVEDNEEDENGEDED